MSLTLTAKITAILTDMLGRAPTADEIILGQTDAIVMNRVKDSFDPVQSIITVDTDEDIQTAIDNLSSDGGGIVNLRAGTYALSADLTVPSNIRIQGVGSNATILDFQNGSFGIKAIGTLLAPLNSIFFNGFSVYNSTTDLIYGQYINTLETFDIQCYNGDSGFNIDNVTVVTIENTVVGACNKGIIHSNVSNFSHRNLVLSTILSGNAINFDTVLQGVLLVVHADTVAGDGISMVDCDGITIGFYTISDCGGNGITLNGVASSIGLNNGQTSGCTGDGIKLISTNAVQIYGCGSFTNTGYGVNISNVGCVNTQIAVNIFTGNTAGSVHDLGTTTQIRSNIGVADN